jgi:hypothetical protein
MFDWTIWLGIGLGIGGVLIALLYTIYQINKERKE